VSEPLSTAQHAEILPPEILPRATSSAPVRLCVGCRGRSGRHELLRIVVVPASDCAPGRWVAEPDVPATQPGRGAWIHPRIECFELAEKRRAWMRAFRLAAPPDTSAVHHHLEALNDAQQHPADQQQCTEEPVGAGAAGLPEKAGREAMSAR
jgi:predicted RNA-binding protein YlxR (DUF448 family)